MIRESFKGHNLDNPEIANEYLYWFFANRFGYTNEQVDDLPYDRTIYFVELEKQFMEREAKKFG